MHCGRRSPRREVVEEALRRPRPWPAGGGGAARDVRLGHDRQLRVLVARPPVERDDDEVDPRAAEHGAESPPPPLPPADEGRVEALGAEDARHALGAAATVGADDDSVAAAGELPEPAGETGVVAEDGRPAVGDERGRLGPVGRREQGGEPGARAGEEAVERAGGGGRRPRGRPSPSLPGRCPGGGERLGEGSLLVDEPRWRGRACGGARSIRRSPKRK